METRPDPRTSYRWSTLGESDLPAWAELVNHLAVVDGTEEFLGEQDLREQLTGHGADPSRDSLAVWDGEQLVGYAFVHAPTHPDHEGIGRAYVDGGVRESHRGRGIGTALMDAAEARARELVAERHPGLAAYVRVSGGLAGSGTQDFLDGRGYAVVRWFNLLGRPTTDAPQVAEPAGARLVSPGEEHREAVLAAHNEAFRDHWGSGPSTPERWAEMWASQAARPAASTLAVDEEGRVLAYVLCGQWVERELYVNLVGTVTRARGRGLAAACLARTVALAGEQGYDVVELDVDSDSLTGATRLYERLGFRLKHQTSSMSKDLVGADGIPVA